MDVGPLENWRKEEGRYRGVLCSMSHCCTREGEEGEGREGEEEWIGRGG